MKTTDYQNIDNDALKRVKLLEKLSPEDKAHIFALMVEIPLYVITIFRQ